MALILFIIIILPVFNIILLLATGKKNKNVDKKLIRSFFCRIFLSAFFATITVISVPILKNNYSFRAYAFIYTITALFILFSFLLTCSFTCFCINCLRNADDDEKGFASLWQTASGVINLCTLDKENGYFKRMLYILFPLLGILYMVFFFGIFETYTANYNEFYFGFEKITGPMFLIAGVMFLFLILVIPLLKGLDFKIAVIVLSSLFLFMYIQNAFLDDKSVMLGNYIAPSLLKVVINNIIFIAFVSVPLIFYYFLKNDKKRNYLFKGSVFVSVFLILIQAAPLPFLISGYKKTSADSPKNGIRKELVLSGEDEFVVSCDKNAVIFVLDTFNSASFEEYISTHPESKEKLKDFVFFDNMSTRALNTGFSMPYILTCSDVDFSVSLTESNKKAWESENAGSFYSSLHDAGYIVNLYTDSDDYCGDADNMVGKIDNVKETEFQIVTDSYKTYYKLLKLSLYKYLPYFMKDFFFVAGSDEINSASDYLFEGESITDSSDFEGQADYARNYDLYTYNYDFYNKLIEGLSIEENKYKLNIYHLSGLHPPYYSLTSDEIVGFEKEEEVCFDLILEYIHQLKEMGLYEDSFIMVTADHGLHGNITNSDPVLLIKQCNVSYDAMKVNSAPGVIQFDFLPTVLDSLGLDDKKINMGISLYKLDENEERERIIRNPKYDFRFKDVPKCNGVGSSSINVYDEYRFRGRVIDIDVEKDYFDTFPIYDFWF